MVGEAIYQQKLAGLTKNLKAYETYDKGVKAYEKGDYLEAQKYALEAIQLEPKECLFHALQGDVLAKLKNPAKALEAYQLAISHNDSYFYPYHQRGCPKKFGSHNEAKMDLAFSQKLLPTESGERAIQQLS